MLANFKGKPELNAENFEGLSAHKGDAITGDDIKDQITALQDELSDTKVSKLYGKTLIDGKKGLKSIIQVSKKEGYKFDKKELGIALEEMDDAGAFSDIELDDAALATLMGQGGNQQQEHQVQHQQSVQHERHRRGGVSERVSSRAQADGRAPARDAGDTLLHRTFFGCFELFEPLDI